MYKRQGETVAWTRADVKDAHDLGLKVRASSTMPIFMPPTTIDGRTYMDGGMGDSWGILLNAARADGYERFCIIRTQPRGYRKRPMSRAAQALFRAAFRAHPIVAERTIARWQPYNELCDEIEQMCIRDRASTGRAGSRIQSFMLPAYRYSLL